MIPKRKRGRPKTSNVSVTMRLPISFLERADDLASAKSNPRVGTRYDRFDIIRAALERGLTDMEREHETLQAARRAAAKIPEK